MNESKNKYDLKGYTQAGCAKHYADRVELIHKMEAIWGTEAVLTYCEITAFKYAARIGYKDSEPVSDDVMKMKWYKRAAKYYFKRLAEGREIFPIEKPTASRGVPDEIANANPYKDD